MKGPELDVFVGRWRSQGHTLPAPGTSITGTDEYEWFPGDSFLVHHVDVLVGDERVRVIELIGGAESPAGGPYPMRSFDNQGQFTEMTAAVDDGGVWTFADRSARATADGRRRRAPGVHARAPAGVPPAGAGRPVASSPTGAMDRRPPSTVNTSKHEPPVTG